MVKKSRDWEEWDRVVGYKLKDPLVGTAKDPFLTENQWAKQYIENLIQSEVKKTIDEHNLMAIGIERAEQGKFYTKDVKQRVKRIIDDLDFTIKHNTKLLENLDKLIK